MKAKLLVKHIVKWTVRAYRLLLFLAATWIFIAYWRSTNECDRATATPTNPMKAVRNCEYGSPDVLKIDVVERLVPDDDQILVKVRANTRLTRPTVTGYGAGISRDCLAGCANRGTRVLVLITQYSRSGRPKGDAVQTGRCGLRRPERVPGPIRRVREQIAPSSE